MTNPFTSVTNSSHLSQEPPHSSFIQPHYREELNACQIDKIHSEVFPEFSTPLRLFWVLTLFLILGSTLSSVGQSITGTVFRDFDANGAFTAIPASGTYTYGEPGVPGVIVTAYSSNSATAPISATTNASGSYTLNVGTNGSYRVEFTNVVTGDFDSFVVSSGTSKTNVQFVTVSGTLSNINLGINYPANYCGVVNPYLVTSCYTNGNPLTAPSSATTNPANDPWLVGWQYNGASSGRNNYLAQGSIGSTWGLAYDRTDQILFTAAFMKRHSGFGTGGPGQIYAVNISSPTSASVTTTIAPFVNLQTDLGINVGTDPRIANPLPNNKTTPNYDVAAFDLVGKMSLGGIDISDDDRTLWVMNLFDQALYELPIGSPAVKPTTYTKHLLPNAGCVNGTLRPFATKFYRGKVYVGAVCSGETSTSTATGNLKALVYVHDPAGATSNFTQVLSFTPNYARGVVTSRGTNANDLTNTQYTLANWLPWIDQWTDIPAGYLNTGYTQTAYPQPILSDIEFDMNGEMIVAFLDRFGHQGGNNNYAPVTSTTAVYEAVAAGDLLRAGRKTDGTYQIENNATVTNIPANGGATSVVATTASVGQTIPQGPGGGEFYWQDMFPERSTPNSDPTTLGSHEEILVGGITLWPGQGEVVSTAFDPFTNFRAAGARYFNNVTGTDNFAYQVLSQDGGLTNAQRTATFGKAASLGDLELLCNPAPIQIGNRVWVDSNDNGVQDPGENPLAGVKVTLSGPGLTSPVSVTTNSNGEYYFANTSGTAATGFAYSLTGLTSGSSYTLTFPTSASAGALVLSTKPNSATGSNADRIDTDPNSAGVISFTLGQSGQNNFSYDAGYVLPASLGDFVFDDKNANGVQDAADTPISGVTVTLYTNGVASLTTTTNAGGLYSFTGLTPGSSLSYSVGFTAPAGFTTILANVGSDDTKDSDGNPATGITGVYNLTAGENNPTIDMGYVKPASLGDFVFVDENKDGIQDAGEDPIEGVTVTLYTNGVASATTVTNASGLYSFTGLTPGASLSYSVGFTTPAGYTATLANAGADDAKDSDTDLITGRTKSVTLASGETNLTLDAGFYLLPAGLGDFVFVDANRNGIQDSGEPGIPGVVTTLYINGVLSLTTLTNASGFYSFTGLTPGTLLNYAVGFSTPSGYTATGQNAGLDDAKDSDADLITGKTQSVTLVPGEFNPTLDAGFYIPSAGLGDFVFVDTNKDGIQDSGEPGIPGVTVVLYTNNVASFTTTTDATGFYSFTGLTPGSSQSYVVGFTAPAGYTATLPNAGSDDARDSDADLITGKTQSVTLVADEFNSTLDAGFYLPAASLTLVVSTPVCNSVTGTSTTNAYTAIGTVSLINATAGQLIITDNGITTASLSITAGQPSASFSLTGLSDASSHSVVATLTGGSSASTVYSAPVACTVCSLSLTTASLPNGQVGMAYSQTLTTTGGSAPLSYTVSGGTLPDGLSLNPGTGLISGTPTAAGSFTATLSVNDSKGCTATLPLTVFQIELAPVCSLSLTVTPGSCTTATNAYTLTGLVNLTNTTTGGIITLTDGLTSTTLTVSSTDTSVPFSLTGLGSNGLVHTLTATLSGCGTTSTTYTAPASCTTAAEPPKLALDKLVDKTKAKLGDILSYTLVLTNVGTVNATNVVVTDSSTVGLSFLPNSLSAPAGTTFLAGTPISTWTVASLGVGQSVSMSFQAKADSAGILYNQASIPGDTATVCTSIPFVMCAGDVYMFRLTAPAGRSSYRWFKDNVELTDQTTNVLDITAPGTYSLAVDNVSGKCPDFSCCPFIVEEDSLPTFRAQAVPVSCLGNIAQTNGRLVLSGFQATNTYQYSLGTSFNPTASLSGAAQVIPTGGVIASTLANPLVAQAYTIRVYNASGCFTDVTVLLLPTVCGCPADVCVPFVISQNKRAKRIGDAR